MATGVSRTASGAALCRLVEQRQPPGLRQFDDPVVAKLVDPGLAAMAGSGVLLDQLLAPFPLGTYGGLVMRTRYIDDVVAAQVAGGITQLVILGAGLDTRAYRLPGLSSVVVFEVDLPAIQRRKQRSLRGTVPVAQEIRFVPVDLGVQPLGEALRNAGLDADRPVLFVWEGVTQYLSEAAVRSTLDVVAGSARGSALVFTYVLRKEIGHAARRGWSSGMFQGFGVVEPWLFGLDQDEVPGFLEEFGLHLMEDVGDLDYQRRYLRPVGRELPVSAAERVALAAI